MTKVDFAPIAAAVRAALEAQGFLKLVGAEVIEITLGEVTMALDRRPEVLQQGNLFHGGVIAFLVDNATTAAAGTVIDRSRHTVLTAEYKLNILAPARGDRLICRAHVLKPGRMLTVVEAKVHCRSGAEEKLTAVALATIANIDLPKVA